jgi:hypothetical protein
MEKYNAFGEGMERSEVNWNESNIKYEDCEGICNHTFR